MSILNAIVLGIVEGITEFLPISSTAHLILVADLLQLPQTNFQKSFEIIIQLGAILSVLVLYWRSFLDTQILRRLMVAFIPTGLAGLLLYPLVKHHLLSDIPLILKSLFIGGLLMIIFERLYGKRDIESQNITDISYTQCLAVGAFQAISIIPGISRAAATIIGGLIVGLPRKAIVEFSFLLAVPTMLAATGFDLAKSYTEFSSNQFSYLLLGFLCSFIVALLSIKFLLHYIKTKNFTSFGFYRIILALLFWLGFR